MPEKFLKLLERLAFECRTAENHEYIDCIQWIMMKVELLKGDSEVKNIFQSNDPSTATKQPS